MSSGRIAMLPDAAWPWLSAALAIAVWALVVAAQWVPVAVLPGPVAVFANLADEFASGRLAENLLASGIRLVIGFAIGAACGVLLGTLTGAFTRVRWAVMPVVEMLRPIPPLAWIPLALIWFGIGEPSKWFLIALTASFPVLVATTRGVESVPRALLWSARMMDVGRARLVAQVLLPAALPDIVTGLRLGWTLGITILVGAEMIAATSGIGFMIIDGMNGGRFDRVIGGILVLGVVSIVTDALFAALARSGVLRWHVGLDQATT
jgi:ABC-type nitrate/sulfonate/bicarbonate transport system permease component